jgi:RNA polymerase sigma-70 factor (ECF subfamily)
VDHISLNEAIRQLAPGYRMVFLLHDIAGFEHEQIGKILGCAVGTSKSQLHKARMKLRWFLSKRALPKNGGTNEKMLIHKKKTYCAAPC